MNKIVIALMLGLSLSNVSEMMGMQLKQEDIQKDIQEDIQEEIQEEIKKEEENPKKEEENPKKEELNPKDDDNQEQNINEQAQATNYLNSVTTFASKNKLALAAGVTPALAAALLATVAHQVALKYKGGKSAKSAVEKALIKLDTRLKKSKVPAVVAVVLASALLAGAADWYQNGEDSMFVATYNKLFSKTTKN